MWVASGTRSDTARKNSSAVLIPEILQEADSLSITPKVIVSCSPGLPNYVWTDCIIPLRQLVHSCLNRLVQTDCLLYPIGQSLVPATFFRTWFS
jgi:hypothetical protein